ncbi:SpoIID/LytB domain-containing protein [Niallia endozanthoxylica]|uniref:SpoIID/LytB domain-containing protein n=1 Tax=Niallia endozanthoxylica TaxID=2036016 RepID=A0A5J5GZ56_9BACI|nr:SpoIID/LytB domain-containing protein [Niallia endozanthoxylica]KAA9013560.1 SpoIID/LytB domain-containing protein [Niallia endozanthoxylica]
MYYGYPGYMYDARHIPQLYRNPYPNGAYGLGYHQPGYIWYPNQSLQRFEIPGTYRHDISTLRQTDPFSVIREHIQAQSTNDWETVTKLWVNEDKKAFEAIVESQEGRQNGEGMLAIENAEIVASKPMSEQLASAIGNYDYYKDKYGEAQTYYVAVKYKVEQDSEFLQNGINYLVATVVKESDQWRMASYSNAPVDIVSASGEGFNTVDEGIAIAAQKRREYGGMIVNKEGALLSINTTKEYLPELEKLIEQPSLESTVMGTPKQFVRTPPATIKVLVKNRRNGRVGSVLTLSFYEYIRHVLPNEWDLRSSSHALKAGALCAIMYAWFFVRTPGFPLVGAHVSDSTDYQAWIKNTPLEKTKITDPHVKNVFQEIRIGMYNEKDNSLFPTQYRSNGYNIDWKGSGIVSQAGTNRLAGEGKHFTQILDWYYSKSSKLRGGKLGFFNY